MSEFKMVKIRGDLGGFIRSKDQGEVLEIALFIRDTMKTKGARVGAYKGIWPSNTNRVHSGEVYFIIAEAPLSGEIYQASTHLELGLTKSNESLLEKADFFDMAFKRSFDKIINKKGK